ncbi:HET-domain-containing protein [Microthyrium microscopicum]|uniref:HET-domain-containing protein n=1 Tax=Microthyrium microscopicum TaxID=703497 RepID=A0A6A6U7U1_9PEZI|nr:HET-domain-containing protein [Microthyrium microscopicum]
MWVGVDLGDIGDPAEAFGITAKRELSRTDSEESFQTALRWIENCKENHICSKRLALKSRESEFLPWPSRLIDVEAFGEGDRDVRLVENDGSKERYVCLSYCWGQSKTFTTTSRFLRLRKTRINYSTLPQTFRDVVTITRRLGVRYVWIDALCIIQDDRLDWEKESVKMGAIYSMAYITIAADSGRDCHSGCFNTASTSQELSFDNTPFPLHSTTPSGEASTIYLWDPTRGTTKPTPPEIDGSPLAERGWVCQERILSPRILHYTTSQLFWECRQTLLAEDNLRPWSIYDSSSTTVCGLARNLYGTTQDPVGRANLLRIWYNHVVSESYSRRKLTRADDKLTAISGIARAFGRHFQSTYLAGLWALDLPWGLSWRRRGLVSRPVEYRAPAFSWASLDAIVEWPVVSTKSVAKIKVVDVHVELSSGDPFGRVSGCWVKVEGYVSRARVTARKRLLAGGVSVVWEMFGEMGQLPLGTVFMDDDEVDLAGQDGERLRWVEYLVLSHDG